MEIYKTDKNSSKRWRWCSWQLVGVVPMAFGLSLLIFFPEFFQNQLLKNLEIRLDSRTFAEWKEPSVTLYLDIYLFNWTNPEEIKNTSSKPKFEQIGPYRFRERPDKVNITFDDTNTTVSYRKLSSYDFDEEYSNGSLSDLWTTVNLVAIGAGSRAQNWGFLLQKAVSIALSNYKEKIYVTKSVGELLFDGYDDEMVKVSAYFENDTPFDKPGFFTKRNGTDMLSGNYTVYTGVDDISKLGSIAKFNNLTQFPYYEEECQKLKGSAGEFFSPGLPKNEPVYLFTPEMCRAIPMEYEADIELHSIVGHRFAAGDRALDNGTLYDENKCFATDKLMPSGVMNVTACSYKTPMFMSFPHFYGADAFYNNAVDGLVPEKENHQMYMTFEPFTSITLEAVARFQTNVLIDNYGDYISLFQEMPRIFMPLFWVEQKFIMDSEKAGQIWMALNIPWIGQVIGVVLIIIGFVIVCFSYLRKILCQKKKNSESADRLVNSSIDQQVNQIVIQDRELLPLVGFQPYKPVAFSSTPSPETFPTFSFTQTKRSYYFVQEGFQSSVSNFRETVSSVQTKSYLDKREDILK